MTNPKNIKALILAGGRGRRLNDLSAKTNKCMIKFHNKHLIENSLHNALILKSSKSSKINEHRFKPYETRFPDLKNHIGNMVVL